MLTRLQTLRLTSCVPAQLLASGFTFLLLAWAFASPPFQVPDEAAHYLRALSISHGALLGPKARYVGETPKQTATVAPNVRAEEVDAHMAPPALTCTDGRPVAVVGHCSVPNYVGNYHPVAYVLPAIAERFGQTVNQALWLGRLASALQCVIFITLAFALLWRQTSVSVIGLLGALTPTTLFMSSIVNPNGVELAANLAFVAGLLRLYRSATTAPRWVWAAITLSGSMMVFAWQLGWLFVIVEVSLVFLILGRGRAWTLVRSNFTDARLAGASVLTAIILYFAWGLSTGLMHGQFGITPLGAGLSAGLTQLQTTLYGAIGLFGPLYISLPSHPYYWIWWAVVILLLGVAFTVANNRERAVLILTTVLALAFPVFFYAWVQRHSGFGLEPRYVIPLLALIPLLSGELIFQHTERGTPALVRLTASALMPLLALFQLFAWWINARAVAGEPNAVWFLHSPRWSPPTGWLLWMIVAVIGAALIVVAAVVDLKVQRRAPALAG